MVMKAPIFCDIGITEQCMFQCKMCKFWTMPPRLEELAIEDWKHFITSLEKSWGSAIRLHFAGGEPLLKKGMTDLLGFAHSKGFRTFIVTNGYLVDGTVARELVRSGVEGISISLDSLDPDTHDALRGKRDAFSHAMQAIDYLAADGAKGIAILSVIMGANLDHIARLAQWAQDSDHISSIYFQAISQPIATEKDNRWFEKDEFKFLWPEDRVRLNAAIDQLIRFKESGYKISNSVEQMEMFKSYFREPDALHNGKVCTQGDYVIYVRPDGDVLLCGSLLPIGNIKRDNIADLWHSEKASARRKQIYACTESCLNVINCFVDKELP